MSGPRKIMKDLILCKGAMCVWFQKKSLFLGQENIHMMKAFFRRSAWITGSTLILFLLNSMSVKAQDIDFDQLLKANIGDANTLMQNYLNPALTGFGYGINGGWYNTAKPHGKLGFDITVSVNAAQVPSADEFFTFNAADYENLTIAPGGSNQLPTLMGPDQAGPDLIASYTTTVQGNQVTVNQTINSPRGLGLGSFNVVPVPTVNAGIGLFKNTDIKVRYMPEVTTKDFNMTLWGVGIMHDIKQWIPVLKKLPFSMSILGAYTNSTITYNLDGVGIDGANQEASFEVNGWTAQLLVSKQLAFLTAYGGVGYGKATSTVDINGTYRFDIDENNPGLGQVTLTDPVNLEADSSGVRATVGLRFKLAFLTLHGDYTLQEYNMISGGIGFSFR